MCIRELSEKFRKNGFDFEIVSRSNVDQKSTIAIVLLRKFRSKNPYGYEVHIVRRCKSHPRSDFEFYEKLASDEDFGSYGWYYATEEMGRAQHKYEDLVTKYETV